MTRRRRLLAIAPIVLVAVGCVAKAAEDTFLQADDLTSAPDAQFDRNEIVDQASFQDALTLDVVTVQAFLDRSPYKHASFLSTYQSNGVRAADAVVKAAQEHRINPLVILVLAEVQQGLIGQQFYPFPPNRVEYVFGCGCITLSKCDPALAGFDRQADCLARALRTSLDQIAKDGQTAGGWAPGKESLTLDNQKVTPTDPSTAALYQWTPQVGFAKSGAWLFWNIWQNYASFLEYDGPIGGGTNGAWIGDACTADPDCIAPGAICATNFPGGMCTVSCTDACPSDGVHPDTFCADFGTSGGYCLPKCDPSIPGACRAGYECKAVYQAGSKTVTENVCIKKQS